MPTLEQLENDYWGPPPENDSYLITRCHQLRGKDLDFFAIEDLRILIGQNIGNKYLIPMAFDKLEINLLAEGDFYPGDLLQSVLFAEDSYWKENLEQTNFIVQLVEEGINHLKKAFKKSEVQKFESRLAELKAMLSQKKLSKRDINDLKKKGKK